MRTSPGWVTHFTLMMLFSLLIVVMGLSAGSPALVIGAMLLAPLMTPVLGTAASLTMALGRPLRRSLLVLTTASLGSVALAWLFSLGLREGPLSSEILARTSPDARDLVVALAAGAAAAYATARADLSNALPGVAVAVALLPPLAVVGMTIESGRTDLAAGALLLYLTNLAAIVAAGVVVFVITGFAPPRRLATTSRRVAIGAGLAAVVVVIVSIPLMAASFRAADRARERQAVEEAIRVWLVGTSDQVDEFSLRDDALSLRLIGLDEPPPAAQLEDRIRAILGETATVTIRWTQEHLVGSQEPGPSAGELLAADVASIVDQWLAAGGVDSYDVTRIDVGEATVAIDVTSAQAPPRVESLSDLLRATLDLSPELEINWTPRTLLRPGTADTTLVEAQAQLHAVVNQWLLSVPGIEVSDLDFDGETVTVDLVGTSAPDGRDLESRLHAALDDATVDIEVWFSQRQAVVPAPTPTPVPTPTPTPTPQPVPSPDRDSAPQPSGSPTPAG